MSPEEAIEEVGMCMGSMTEKLAWLAEVLPKIDVVETYRPPKCPCGAVLSTWPGRHTGLFFIYHPGTHRPCLRAGYKGQGATQHEALLDYLTNAPDLGLDAQPVDEPEADDFSADFT